MQGRMAVNDREGGRHQQGKQVAEKIRVLPRRRGKGSIELSLNFETSGGWGR